MIALHEAYSEIFAHLSVNNELLSHSLKTAHLCWQALQFLPKDFVNVTPGEMYLAGLLHDIGKTRWPSEMFSKPHHCLTIGDRLLMDSHSLEGARIAKAIFPEINEGIIEIIATHHERPGGKGYPKGKKNLENETLLLAACDVFCACTEQRKYRKDVLANSTTIEIIKEFAPVEIVEAIINGQMLSQNKTGVVYK